MLTEQKTLEDRARDIMLHHCYEDAGPSATTWVRAKFMELEFEILEALKSAVKQEREECCKLVYGHASSDNAAERTVRAIRKRNNG